MSFALTSGAIPTGLAMNATTGEFTGTPTVAGTYNFTVTYTDANGCTASRAYAVVIDDCGSAVSLVGGTPATYRIAGYTDGFFDVSAGVDTVASALDPWDGTFPWDGSLWFGTTAQTESISGILLQAANFTTGGQVDITFRTGSGGQSRIWRGNAVNECANGTIKVQFSDGCDSGHPYIYLVPV